MVGKNRDSKCNASALVAVVAKPLVVGVHLDVPGGDAV